MRKKKTPEQIQLEIQKNKEESLKRDYLQTVGEVKNINEPTRFFEVGEEIVFKNDHKYKILEKHEFGKFYLIESEEKNSVFYSLWCYLYKSNSNISNDSFHKDNMFLFNFYNTPIYSLIEKFYHDRINMNPDYQRDLVWSIEDKVNLIDSIYNDIEIGRFAFIKIDYSKKNFDFDKDYYWEILDGKQRITTIIDFFEDRFAYKGKFYSELSKKDKYHFRNFMVSLAETPEKSKKEIYEYFIRLNTCGRIVDKEHLDKIKKMIDE